VVVVYLVTTLLQIFTKCAGEKKLKIGQYLAKIWATLYLEFSLRRYASKNIIMMGLRERKISSKHLAVSTQHRGVSENIALCIHV